MTIIEKVRDLEKTMLAEAEGPMSDEAREHIYELFNYISDWEAIWTNSEFDIREK